MVILKGIPRLLSPQLLSVLARMGHGDEIGTSSNSNTLHTTCCISAPAVLADANFPSAAIAKHGPELVRADGMSQVTGVESVIFLNSCCKRYWYSSSPEGCDIIATSGWLCLQTCNILAVLCVQSTPAPPGSVGDADGFSSRR